MPKDNLPLQRLAFPSQRYRRLTLLLLALSFLCWPAAAPRSQLTLTVKGYKLSNYALAIPDFIDRGTGKNLGVKIARVLRKDFKLSGMFRVLAPSSYLEKAPRNGIEPASFDFTPWRTIGAQGLLKGSVSLTGGSLRIRYRFYEVGTGRLALKQDLTLSAKQRKQLRWYIHTIAEKIYRYLAKEPGIFTTRIACIIIRGSRQELWAMDFDGSNARKLTNNGSINVLPAWSPNGRNIVFTSTRNGVPKLFIMTAEGKHVYQITFMRGIFQTPTWSPSFVP